MNTIDKLPIIILIISISLSTLNSQESIQLPEDIYVMMTGEDIDGLNKNFARIMQYDYNELTKASKGRYNLINTVYRIYNEKDSVDFYFNRAYKMSTKSVCLTITGYERYHKRRVASGEISSGIRPFIHDMVNIDADVFLDNCNRLLDSLKSNDTKEAEIIISKEILEIKNNDRKYRVNGNEDWSLQNELDSINRNLLDSLYFAKKSLKPFSEDELFVISLVLHHSADCDWNKKWTRIFFYEKTKSNLHGLSLLGPAMDRMYDEKDGYCYTRDSLTTKLFLNELKVEFPKIFSEYIE